MMRDSLTPGTPAPAAEPDAGFGVVPAEPGFGIYVHWPFCAQKCPYCDFNSHVPHGGIDEARFLAASLAEIDHTAARIGRREVSSVFLGGGTPSLMSATAVGAILDRIAQVWTIASGAEITLEANPSSVEADRFQGYRSAGVNRVSMGVQSLRDEQLQRLGRLHDVAEAKAAIEIARTTFDRFSFDLIYARPGQTPAEWEAELREALLLAGDHLSLYQLTVEPGTPFAALYAMGKLVIPDPDAAHALYALTQDMMEDAGLPAYEVSNHARPGQESRHNLLYWRYGEYAGVGAGAHGRLIIDGRRVATVTERKPEAWAALVEASGHGVTEEIALTDAEAADEMLLMGLRLGEGLDLGRLARLTGFAPSEQEIGSLVTLGLVERVRGPLDRRECEIAQCVAPGVGPGGEWADVAAPAQHRPRPYRIRATRDGRFVLNEIVRRMSVSFGPA